MVSRARPNEAQPQHVLLVHGLWMRGLSMLALRQRLAEAGFITHGFEYASVAAQPRRALERLRLRMCALAHERPDARVHVVGHSLGGLVALQCVEAFADELPWGRIVCLGTPLAGSAAARGLLDWPLGERVLGRNLRALLDGVPDWHGAREVGVVAGTLQYGLGAWFGHFAGAHDGTVAVAETRLPGIADHCVVQASHLGLLFSAPAAVQTIQFLRDGCFQSGGADASVNG